MAVPAMLYCMAVCAIAVIDIWSPFFYYCYLIFITFLREFVKKTAYKIFGAAKAMEVMWHFYFPATWFYGKIIGKNSFVPITLLLISKNSGSSNE